MTQEPKPIQPQEALIVGNCSMHCSTSCIHALVIEFLDQLREVLMNTYGDQIEHQLRETYHPDKAAPPSFTKPR